MKPKEQTQGSQNRVSLNPPPKKFISHQSTRRSQYNPYNNRPSRAENNSRWSSFKNFFSSISSCCKRATSNSFARNTVKQDFIKKYTQAEDKEEATITFDDEKDQKMPKLNNIDENRLNEQINRFKSKDGKPENIDPKDPEFAVPSKSCLKNSTKNKSLEVDKSVDASESIKSHTNNEPKDVEQAVCEPADAACVKSGSDLSKGGNFAGKRKHSQIENSNDKMQSLMDDLEQSVIPASKQTIRRKKTEESVQNGKKVNLAKAKRRKQRHQNSSSQEESSNSESSDESVTSKDRDELMVKYFKKILGPLLYEERSIQKKETKEMIENMMKEQENRLSRDPNADPFLEDEGFAPSDHSSTPSVAGRQSPFRDRRLIPSRHHSQYVSYVRADSDVDMRGSSRNVSDISGQNTPNTRTPQLKMQVPSDNFKLGRKSSASQERNSVTGTPKRVTSTSELQQTVIFPKEIDGTKKISCEKRLADLDDESKPEKQDVPKSTLFNQKIVVEKSQLIFGKGDQADKNKEEKSEDTVKEKVVVKSLFGSGMPSIESLKQKKTSGTSSPSFGETPAKPESKETTKLDLFKPKDGPIPEAKNEDDGDEKETKPATAKPFGMFTSKIGDKKDDPEKPKPTSVFVSGVDAKPKNLFAKPAGAEGKPETKVSLFNKTEPTKPTQSVFGSSTGGSSLFGAKTSTGDKKESGLFAKPTEDTKEDHNDDGDVGMGGVTPPKRSPIQSSTSSYQFQRVGSSDQSHNQGSGASKPTSSLFGASGSGPFSSAPSTGSIFRKPTGGQGAGLATPSASTSIFNMGTSGKEVGKSVSLFGGAGSKPGGLFGTAPTQGQPDTSSKPSGWGAIPFNNKKSKDEDDDGLFSGFNK